MKIYLIDIIGIHSGAFYYNKAFRDILRKRFTEVEIVSNYHEEDGTGRKIFLNYYNGNLLSKIMKLTLSFFRFLFFVINNRNSCYIFMTYGNAYEIIFLFPLLFARLKIIDVHEIISLIDNKGSNGWIRRIYARIIYRRIADIVIIHSTRSANLLSEFGYNGAMLEVPHFSYQNVDDSGDNKVTDEVKTLISDSRINILFFGFIRRSKGTDILTDIILKSSTFDPDEKLNFIVAGNDPDKLLLPLHEGCNTGNKCSVSLLLRFIKDQELSFLFRNCDYVFLPYTQISQSGVMEMAIRFRKPVITSDLPYFKEIIEKFPSFGYSCINNEYKEYLKIFKKLIELRGRDEQVKYYTESDLEKFNCFKDPESFLNDLGNVLSQVK